MCVPNDRDEKQVKQMCTELKKKLTSTIIVGDFNTPLLCQQLVDHQTEYHQEYKIAPPSLNRIYLTGFIWHYLFHTTIAEYSFFPSSIHGSYTKRDHIIGHKRSSGNLKKKKSYTEYSFWPQWNQTTKSITERQQEIF